MEDKVSVFSGDVGETKSMDLFCDLDTLGCELDLLPSRKLQTVFFPDIFNYFGRLTFLFFIVKG